MIKPDQLSQSDKEDFINAFEDHPTFCRESLKIRNEAGSLVPMELRVNQQKTSDKIRAIRKKGKPVRLVVLKSRRITNTAALCAEMFHDVPFWSGTKATIVADAYTPAGLEALGYLTTFQNEYRPLQRHGAGLDLPNLARDVIPEEGELRETVGGHKIVWENNSFVQVLSAEAGDVGRGGGRKWALLDEVAWWTNPALTLTSVLNMVPYIRGTVVVIQSTANGVGGEFYELCMKAMDPSNLDGYEFLFVTWTDNPECVAELDVDLHTFQESLDKEEKVLQATMNLSLKQLRWRRLKIAIECRGDVNLFHQEYPTTPMEAFLASGRPALDTRAVSRQKTVDGMVGELVQVDEYPQPRIIFEDRDRGALTVFRQPQKGVFYVAGSDPSKGIDVSDKQDGSNPDYSVTWLAEQQTGEMVALLRARLRPGEFGRYSAAVCKWYNYAFWNPESNDPGFIDAIIASGYPERWIFSARRMPGDQRSTSVQELGYYVDANSRKFLIDAFNMDLRDGLFTIRSKVAVAECYTFVYKPNGKAEHMKNCHDDIVFAGCHMNQARRYAPVRREEHRETMRAGTRPVRYGEARKRRDDDD